MKAKITNVRFVKEFEGKYGLAFVFGVSYDGKEAQYISKSKDQTKFVKGQEAEFTETVKDYRGEEQITIKPIQTNTGNFGRAVKKEQSRYSGFAMSYAKDLCVADKIKITELRLYTTTMFNLMVELDKTLES